MTARYSLDKSRIRVLLLEGVHDSALKEFAEAGYSNVERLPGALADDALADALKGVHLLGLRSRSQLNARALKGANRLIAAGCFCIGTNQVDLAGAAAAGIPVFNAPFSNTRSVAELVLAQAILLLRGVPEKNALMHRGVWRKSAKSSFEIRGKTLGVIGYGNIGSQLGVLAEGLGMKVVFHDVVKRLNMGNAQQVESMAELLAVADVVTLHVPATDQTKDMFGAEQIRQMRGDAILINASRGNVVDLDALATAMEAGHLLGAAIDVFPSEPKANDDPNDPFESRLRALDNVILTPHVGGSTVEAQANIGIEVAQKLIRFSDNGSTLSAVNFPEVALPEHTSSHRLLHIHENVPGVLGQINQVFSSDGINIAAQYLQTRDNLGYVVIDLDAEQSDTAVEQLRKVPGTLRTRVLF